MIDYFIRTIDRNKLYTLAKALGVLIEQDGVYTVHPDYDGAWEEVGEITKEVVDSDGNVTTTPVTDKNGVPWWHANLRINADLSTIAMAKATANPAIAQALGDLPSYFVVDSNGRAAQPTNPARVWA